MDPASTVDIWALKGRMSAMSTTMQAELDTQAAVCAAHVTHIAGAATGLAIIIGGTQDVVVGWPVPFDNALYTVEIVLMGLLGKATADVLAQDAATVTVRVTAGLLVAAGTQFLVYGRV